jgi:hypothetical protein
MQLEFPDENELVAGRAIVPFLISQSKERETCARVVRLIRPPLKRKRKSNIIAPNATP